MSNKIIIDLIDSDSETTAVPQKTVVEPQPVVNVPIVPVAVPVPAPVPMPVTASVDLTMSDDEPIIAAPKAPETLVIPMVAETIIPAPEISMAVPSDPVTEPKDSAIPPTVSETSVVAPMETEPTPMEVETKVVEKKKKKKTKKTKEIVSDGDAPKVDEKKEEPKKKRAPKKIVTVDLDDQFNRLGQKLHMLSLDVNADSSYIAKYSDELNAPNETPIREEGCISTCLDALSPLRIGRQKLCYQNLLVRFIKAMQEQNEVKASLLATCIMVLVSGAKNSKYRDLGFVKKRTVGFNTLALSTLWEGGSGDIWHVLSEIAKEMEEKVFEKFTLDKYFRTLNGITEKKKGIFVMIAYMCRNKRKDSPDRALQTQDIELDIQKLIDGWKSEKKDQITFESFYEPSNLKKLENLIWKKRLEKIYSSECLMPAPDLKPEDDFLFDEIENEKFKKASKETNKEETPETKEEASPKEKPKKERKRKAEKDESTKEKRQKKEKAPPAIEIYEPLPGDFKPQSYPSFCLRNGTVPYYVHPKGLFRIIKSTKYLDFISKSLDYAIKERFITLENATILIPKIYKRGKICYAFYPLEIKTDPSTWRKNEPITFGLCNLYSFLSKEGNESCVASFFRDVYTAFSWFKVFTCANYNLEDNALMDEEGKLYFLGFERSASKTANKKDEEEDNGEDLTSSKENKLLFFLNRSITQSLVDAFAKCIKNDNEFFSRIPLILQACLTISEREEAEKDLGEKLPDSLETFLPTIQSFIKGSETKKADKIQKFFDVCGLILDCMRTTFGEEDTGASGFYMSGGGFSFGPTTATEPMET